MFEPIDLNSAQKKILGEFYSKPFLKIKIDKKNRNKIWQDFIRYRDEKKYMYLETEVPAFFHELRKAKISGNNIQSAVFSECVYAQALADLFELTEFDDHICDVAKPLININYYNLQLKNLSIRYSYTDQKQATSLLQGGGAGEIDCALISLAQQTTTMIEFKEPYAKTSEVDLPKYGDDGYLINSAEFEEAHPQFISMLEEQIKKRLNIFGHLGNNVKNFSAQSVAEAVLQNYAGKKFADVICTEDKAGFLVMLPANDLLNWASLGGELRPSGRNGNRVWSSPKLVETIRGKGGSINSQLVTIDLSQLKPVKERGGSEKNRIKISPLFFVKKVDVKIQNKEAIFHINSVKQLRPTITAKLNFKNLEISAVRDFYMNKIQM